MPSRQMSLAIPLALVIGAACYIWLPLSAWELRYAWSPIIAIVPTILLVVLTPECLSDTPWGATIPDKQKRALSQALAHLGLLTRSAAVLIIAISALSFVQPLLHEATAGNPVTAQSLSAVMGTLASLSVFILIRVHLFRRTIKAMRKAATRNYINPDHVDYIPEPGQSS